MKQLVFDKAALKNNVSAVRKRAGASVIFAVLVGVGFAQFIVCMLFALKVEQTAGYYECAKCGHRYVPAYCSVSMAMHVNRTRYMKCPACGKRSWQKKVLNKEDN